MNRKACSIAISSGKGGAGKTTLSVHLADFWHAQNQPVALVDVDVEEPNDALFFSFARNESHPSFRMVAKWDESLCTHCLRCKGTCSFNALLASHQKVVVYDTLCHGCGVCVHLCPQKALRMSPFQIGSITDGMTKNRLRVVTGTLDVGQELAAPLVRDTVTFALDHLSEDTILLMDTAPGVSCSFVAAVESVDAVILVAEPTRFGRFDLDLAVQALTKLERPFGVVINKYEPGLDCIHEYCSSQSIPILGCISLDTDIARALSEGSIVWKEFPMLSQALESITNRVLDRKKRQVLLR